MRDVARIRELRYGDGLSAARTAEVVGCCEGTVLRYAPGSPGRVPVAPVREAFEASRLTAADVARRLGWWDRGSADSARLKRALGINGNVPADPRYRSRRYYSTLIDAETAALIAEAIGVAPWEVLPDEDEEMAAPRGYTLRKGDPEKILAAEGDLLRSEGINPEWPGIGEAA